VSIGTVPALEVHLAAIHGVRKKFTCLRCNFSSNNRSLLLDHVRWSREGRPVKCRRSNCHARFATVDERRRHVEEEHELLRCPVCLEGFGHYHALERHKMKNHVELYSETELTCKVWTRFQFIFKTLIFNILLRV
jgi:transcription elongation factor Elf1